MGYDSNKVSRVVLVDPSTALEYAGGASVVAMSPLNITDTADHIVKSGAGMLGSVVLNTGAATSTLKVYDGTTAGGTLLATIDGTGTTKGPFEYNVAVTVGVFAKATGTADWTVTYH